MKTAPQHALLFICLLSGHFSQAQSMIAQGDALLIAGEKSKAMAKYVAAVDSAATPATWSARARGWYETGKYEKALKDLTSALAVDSMYAPANELRAVYAFRADDNEGVVKYAGRALATDPKPAVRSQMLVLRGQSRATLRDNKEALADLKEGLGDRTDDLPAMKVLARLYDLNGQYAESLAVLESLCSLEPDDLGNWSNRGYELNQMGRYDDALAVLETALGQDKDEPVVLSNKAYALMKTGRDADALKTVERSLKSSGNNPYALRTRAELRIRKGDRAKGCDDLTLAKALGSAPGVDELIKQNCGGAR
ncbi:MAG: tetratricopeptide repeat protein [Flavobacteriales bacterium]|nr:tetratricopeptide repeat protein [Flavobacteriales bacterium]